MNVGHKAAGNVHLLYVQETFLLCRERNIGMMVNIGQINLNGNAYNLRNCKKYIFLKPVYLISVLKCLNAGYPEMQSGA